MSYPPFFISKLWRAFAFASLIASLALVAASPARGQMGGIDTDIGDVGGGGTNSIQGRIFFPSGRMADQRIKVQLVSVMGGTVFALTDDNGAFTFRRLAGGSYTLTVDPGKDYQPVTETVDIIQPARRGGFGVTYNVQIQLKLRESTGNKPGVVNAALASVPKPALDLYQKAEAAIQNGESKKAIEYLKNAVSIYPEFALAFNELGLQYLNAGELDKAAEAFKSAIFIAPDQFIPRLNYGIILVRQKKFAQAEQELKIAVEKNSSSVTARLFRARSLIWLQRYAEAEKELQQTLTLGGDESIVAHKYLGALYNEQGALNNDHGQYARAIAELEKYLSLAPKAKDAEQVRTIIKQIRVQTATK